MSAEQLRIKYKDVPHSKDTNDAGVNRFERRVENMFSKNTDRIVGRRVLDLACNTGRLSYPLLMLGAASVTGVEARRELIDRGEKIFAATPYAGQMKFEQGDLFDFLANAHPGQFDVIVCAGFLYHTVRHADFFREVKRLGPETVIIDTNVAKNYIWFGRQFFGKPPALFMYNEDPSKTSDTTDPDGVVYWPSTSYLEAMLDGAGYDWERVDFKKNSNGNWAAMGDYKNGTRAAYVGRRR
ncbi:D-3-phosphoglycerate dehydrogenase [hydrothermal vent metagenome]|uniref:D-3-phosphoglycerate dehydrogenase n=1 Tax=hydrothermal vent metagenome TaxID=652676 RepID=A0A3B0R7Y2_9ZZZZ